MKGIYETVGYYVEEGKEIYERTGFIRQYF